MSPETLRHLVQSWHAKGFQPNTHAIGDAANRIAIDIYEEILQRTGKTNDELRFRIEHAQILVRHLSSQTCSTDKANVVI